MHDRNREHRQEQAHVRPAPVRVALERAGGGEVSAREGRLIDQVSAVGSKRGRERDMGRVDGVDGGWS